MKITLGTNDIMDYLLDDAPKAWTRSGARAMAEWLEEMEEDCRMELDFDAVAIRCGYSEYETVMEAASEYGWEADSAEYVEQHEAAARQYLEARTEIRLFSGGVLVLNF
jgi:hypothetical protein